MLCNNLLTQDELDFLYLFPKAGKLPVINIHPFANIDKTTAQPIVKTMADPDYFGWTCKILFGLDLFPQQISLLRLFWTKPFPMLIAGRGSGKSFILATYVLLRAILDQGVKIVIVGAGLRQAKVVFSYIENIWLTSPILRSIIGGGIKAGPKYGVDSCYFNVGMSRITALPLGDGSKIRGYRANVIIADEFASIPSDIFEVVVRGFVASSKTPVEDAKNIAIKKKLESLGYTTPKLDNEGKLLTGNQIIYSGTAYYSFNHFCKKYDLFKRIISSRGDKDKIIDIFGSESNVPEDFDWRDYAVVKLPYTRVSEGLLDKRQLAHGKATLPKNIFLMEYGACLLDTALIETRHGVKKIVDVNVGDEVLTHKNRWKKIISKKLRYYDGKMSKFRAGRNDFVDMTIDHPVYTDHGFVCAGDLKLKHKLSVPKPNFNDKYIFDLGKYTYNYNIIHINGQEYIRPIWSSQKTKICFIKYSNKKSKSDIPRYVDDNYDLGFILGIYAGDGDINKKGTQIQITFNANQEDKAMEFCEAINRVFGLNCTHRLGKTKGYNILRVFVNSRIVCDFIKNVIGKYSKYKNITIENLFNRNMAMGFIRGYWLSDGYDHLCTKRNPHIGSINYGLLCFTRRLLNSLGCLSYIRYRNPKISTLKDGRKICGQESWLLIIDNKYLEIFKKIINNEDIFIDSNLYIYPKDYTEYNYSGYVYNLEIGEDHSFYANGIIHHNCFVSDSDGFFPRSLIEGCTPTPSVGIPTPDGDITFIPMLEGIKGRQYVIAIDPGADVDNFAIVVLERWRNHTRIVYCWTINKKEFEKRKNNGFIKHKDYYDYCCYKIRTLVKKFPPLRIVMDAQSGGAGKPIAEMLRNKKLMEEDDQPIYEIIDLDNPKPTDDEDGPHILEMITPTNEWNSDSSIFLHNAFETKSLLFPAFDTLKIHASIIAEYEHNIRFDTFEDCANEIEELKNELCIITTSETESGKVKFSTPKTKSVIEGHVQTGRLRKDRFSALCMGFRYIHDVNVANTLPSINYSDIATNLKSLENKENRLYVGAGVGGMAESDWHKSGPGMATKNGNRLK